MSADSIPFSDRAIASLSLRFSNSETGTLQSALSGPTNLPISQVMYMRSGTNHKGIGE